VQVKAPVFGTEKYPDSAGGYLVKRRPFAFDAVRGGEKAQGKAVPVVYHGSVGTGLIGGQFRVGEQVKYPTEYDKEKTQGKQNYEKI
jgi:hypothetical protein